MSGGVKKIAQVVVGAVIGFVQGGPVGAVIGAGLAFYAAEQQEKLNTKSPLRDNEPSAQTVRSSKAPVRFILGRVATGGVLVWAQEQSGAQTEGEWLHLVYVLCEGAVDALEDIYLGEEPIASFAGFASYELVVNPTQVNSFLKANCPDWKDSQIGRGLSFVRLSLMYSSVKFPSGIPDVRFIVRGRNDVFDPRTNTCGYSANTALHILWYLRSRCNVPDDEIVFSTFASAANVCDEAVTNADGSVSQRYRSACVIGADELKSGVLQKLEAACAGRLIRVGGRWMLQAGAYYGPYDFEITEDMVIGTIGGSTEPTNDSAINTVRGTFIDPSQSWTETDYPEVSVSEWVTEDGGEAAETLTYSYVTDAYQPQRLANIELRRRRAGGVITIPMNFSGYNCRPGRVVRVNLPSLNILGEFIVTNWSMGDNEGCNVQVQQYEVAIFDDAVGQPYDPLGFISLPSGGLGSPTGLTWMQDTGAEVVQGVLSWMAPAGIVTEYAVIIRQGSGVAQSHTVQAASNSCQINGLPSGSYTMSVAAIGPMARSGEVTITVSIQGPPIPESCSVQSSIDSITLTPNNVLHGLNGGTYEYFFSVTPQATAGESTYLGQGLSFTHTGLAFYTNYYYFIRSSNAYGKSAFLYVPTATSNNVGTYLDALKGKIDETQLAQLLNDRINLIDGNGPGSVNSRINAAKDELEGLIDQIVDALEYDPAKTYVKGDIVRQGQNLFQAIGPVPANTPPPNANCWFNMGTLAETTNAMAVQIQQNSASITEIGNEVTSQASQLSAVKATVNDPVTGVSATASGLSTLKATVTTLDGKVTTTAQRVDGIYLQVNPPLQGDDSALMGSDAAYVGVWSTQSALIEGDLVQGQRMDSVEVKVASNAAAIATEQAARLNADGALATSLETVRTTVNGNSLAIQTNSTAIQTVNGKVTANWSVRMQYESATGLYKYAGIGLGLENGPGGLQSQFIIDADRFAIGQAGTVPFAVTGGQTFIKAAFIQDGTITNAKIGNYIQSNNYDPGKAGWKLFFDGTFEMNGVVPGQGRSMMTNRSLRFWDAGGNKRVQIGDLTE
ncbi:phage tail tip fiber protein [Pseudomonas sp. R11F]|uniref:phage tail tip fiber protein n=1 Tax=Pseudomonas TaxID=286 RepID=UPI00398F5F46